MLAAIDAAGRDEFFMVGGAGSKNAMEAIKAGDTRARRRRSSTRRPRVPTASVSRASSRRARRWATSSRSDVPNRIVLNAPVVTADNVDQYLPTAFTS